MDARLVAVDARALADLIDLAMRASDELRRSGSDRLASALDGAAAEIGAALPLPRVPA